MPLASNFLFTLLWITKQESSTVILAKSKGGTRFFFGGAEPTCTSKFLSKYMPILSMKINKLKTNKITQFYGFLISMGNCGLPFTRRYTIRSRCCTSTSSAGEERMTQTHKSHPCKCNNCHWPTSYWHYQAFNEIVTSSVIWSKTTNHSQSLYLVVRWARSPCITNSMLTDLQVNIWHIIFSISLLSHGFITILCST